MESQEAENKKDMEPPLKPYLPPKPNVVDKPLIGDRTNQRNTVRENIETINKEVEAMVKAKTSKRCYEMKHCKYPRKREMQGKTPKDRNKNWFL